MADRCATIDALILLNDMAFFSRDEQQLVHSGASMPVRQGVGRHAAAETLSCLCAGS
jgi:hypothetical protein